MLLLSFIQSSVFFIYSESSCLDSDQLILLKLTNDISLLCVIPFEQLNYIRIFILLSIFVVIFFDYFAVQCCQFNDTIYLKCHNLRVVMRKFRISNVVNHHIDDLKCIYSLVHLIMLPKMNPSS